MRLTLFLVEVLRLSSTYQLLRKGSRNALMLLYQLLILSDAICKNYYLRHSLRRVGCVKWGTLH